MRWKSGLHSQLKELHQTLIVWMEVTEGSQFSYLCGHRVPSELVKEDAPGGCWTGLGCYCFMRQVAHTPLCSSLRLHLLKQRTQLSCCFQAERCPEKSAYGKDNCDWRALELCRSDLSGTWSIIISLTALWVSTCLHLNKLLSFCHVSVHWNLDWPCKHQKLNRQSSKKKITALPKCVWYLPWVCVLQQCTFPIPVSDNEQQHFWGVFAFWSPLWSNAIVHWQKRCEVQNKVMKLIWFPTPNPSIYMPLLY